MSYRVSRAAHRDLLEIFLDWAERASLKVAARIVERITARFRLLGEHPGAGKSAENLAPGVRCFAAGKYLIYYRKSRQTVDVLHIFHSARDQRSTFSEK